MAINSAWDADYYDDAINNALGTDPKCYSGADGDILKMLDDNKNSIAPIKCIVNSGQTIQVHASSTMGGSDGSVVITMKAGTIFEILSITRTCIMKGNSQYYDTNNLQLTGKIKIPSDTNKSYIYKDIYGYLDLNSNPTSSWNNGKLKFTVMKKGSIHGDGVTVVLIKDNPKVASLFVNTLSYTDGSLNTSTLTDTEDTKEYNDHLQDYDKKVVDILVQDKLKDEGFTPDIDSYFPTLPKSWKKGYNIQEIEEYYNSLDSLDISKLRGIFGIPYQYLPTTDCRIDGSNTNEVFGISYTEMIASRLPLLFITPGEPAFLADAGDKKKSFIADILQNFASNDSDHLSNLLDEYNGKLYSIEPAYSTYFKYVNPMCRMGAFFCGLNKPRDGEDGEDLAYRSLDGVELESYNWAWNDNGDYEGNYSGNDDGGSNNTGFSKIASNLADFQKTIYYRSAIPLYINSETSFTETMSNETTESSLASGINGLSDKARELQFLIGSTSSAVAQNFDNAAVLEGVAASRQAAEDIVNKLTTGNIFSSLFKNIKTVVSGGRLQFPNIWSNSTFSKSYSINIKLTTPDYDKKSWYLNIYVPLCHLIALILPRGEFQNGYTAPFIIKAFYKGMFNIDMGIITDMTITKGKEGGWTKDCLPTSIDVSFTIQDLYSSLSMTPSGALLKSNTMQNIAEMDYLANTCGVNINEPDILRMIEMYVTFNVKNVFLDVPTNIVTGIENWTSNNISKLYNSFI